MEESKELDEELEEMGTESASLKHPHLRSCIRVSLSHTPLKRANANTTRHAHSIRVY